MKLVKAIAIIGLLVLLIAFFIHMAEEWMAVKSVEPTVKRLPKIQKELNDAAKQEENRIKQASEEDSNKKDQE